MLVERKLDVDGVGVQLREWGDSGMPVIFWHALGDHSSMQMAEVGPMLVRDYGLHVVGVDAPGFGGSVPRLPDAEYEVPALTAFIGRLLDALDFDRPAWLGSSWGAALGMAVAGSSPEKVRALALIDGGYFHDPYEPLLAYTLDALREEERTSPEYRWPTWEAADAEYRGSAGRWSPELEAYVRSVMVERDGEVLSIMGPDVFAAAVFGLLRLDLTGAQERLGRSNVPVLLLAGMDVPEADAKPQRHALRRFQARVPQAEVRRLKAPHLMLEAQPAKVARIIGPWLRSRLVGA